MKGKIVSIDDAKNLIHILLCDFAWIDGRVVILQGEMDAVSELSTKMITENMHRGQ